MSKPRIEIEYCTGCRWLLRAAWMAQELLTTFEKELGGVPSFRAREASWTSDSKARSSFPVSRKADFRSRRN